MESIVAEYRHHRTGTIHALAADGQPNVPAMADWVAVKAGAGVTLGYVTDSRADSGGLPSAEMPADEDAKPFEAFTRAGKFITCTHSLRGALLAIGNRA